MLNSMRATFVTEIRKSAVAKLFHERRSLVMKPDSKDSISEQDTQIPSQNMKSKLKSTYCSKDFENMCYYLRLYYQRLFIKTEADDIEFSFAFIRDISELYAEGRLDSMIGKDCLDRFLQIHMIHSSNREWERETRLIEPLMDFYLMYLDTEKDSDEIQLFETVPFGLTYRWHQLSSTMQTTARW